jgi:16S rRNA processing protein RimM
MTDFPERFSALKTVYLGEEQTPYPLLRSRVQREGRQVLLRLGGVLDCDQADKLRGQMIYIPVEQAMPLEEGQYYIYQILGLSVETEAGEPLGLLTEVLLIGSNDVYVVSDGSREILIPALEDVILTVDLSARKMIVRLLDGLL